MSARYCKQNCNGKDTDGLCTSADCCEFFLWDVERERGYKPQPQTVPTEAEEQEELVAWGDAQGIVIVHIPNERKCTAYVAGQLLRQGMRKGFPDNFIPIRSRGWGGLFIELKRRKKSLSRKSEEQKTWIERLRALGYWAEFCYGAEEAVQVIRSYLGEIPGNVPSMAEYDGG